MSEAMPYYQSAKMRLMDWVKENPTGMENFTLITDPVKYMDDHSYIQGIVPYTAALLGANAELQISLASVCCRFTIL